MSSTNIRVKVEANYGTTVAQSDDPALAARVIALILDHEAAAAQAMTPEQIAMQAVKEELEEVRSQLNSERWRRESIQDELKKLQEAQPASEEV